MMTHAPSTVAMSVYNMVASTGRAVRAQDAAAIAAHLHTIQLPGVDGGDVERALSELERRKLLIRKGERLDVVDRHRRIVVRRDRSDAYTDEVGDIHGGWNGWIVRDLLHGDVRLAEVAR